MKTGTLCTMRYGGLGAALGLVIGIAGAGSSAQAADIPMSARSAAVWQKVEPGLGDQLQTAGLRLGDPIFIRVFKEPAELEVWVEGFGGRYTLFRTYEVCDFSGRLGPKLEQGDRQAPEGFYYVSGEQLNPNSHYHLSFDLGYPNAYDRGLGRSGSKLMIHGDCVSVGCYAMTDQGIEEIYSLIEAALRRGQGAIPVHVFPFRMSERAMYRHRRSPWIDFWQNLKQGYDLFEKDRRPPLVAVASNRYLFGNSRGWGQPVLAQADTGDDDVGLDVPLRDQLPGPTASAALSARLTGLPQAGAEQPIRASILPLQFDNPLMDAADRLGLDRGVVSKLFPSGLDTSASLQEPNHLND